jgi:molybdopterin synthase catalytic subunit
MQITLRLFAGHRDIVGQAELTLSVAEGTTIDMVWQQLTRDYPRLAGYTGRVLYAINQEYSEPDSVLHAGDEVAFIPPVSGGSPEDPAAPDAAPDTLPPPFVISEHPLNAAPLQRLVQTPQDGAIVTFAGVVRDNFDGRATARLSYEAYSEMAVPVLRQLAAEAQQRWPIGQVAVHHRVGLLEIGETAVLVVVAAPHRQAAFAAAAFIMDRIKEVAPIWKQEHWADGAREWRE